MMKIAQSFRPLFAIAKVTFQEIILDKVLYNFILVAFLLLGVSYLAGTLTFIGYDRVVLDFGMSAINFSCAVIAIFQGGAMLAKEFDRRTIFVALARPISRLQFIFGKFLGLSAVLFLNWFLLAGTELMLFKLMDGVVTETIFYGLVFLWLQACFLAAFALFFSSFTTTSIAIMLTIGIYLIGNNIEPLRTVLEKSEEEWIRTLFVPLVGLLPNLSHFNLGFLVTYGIELEPGFTWRTFVYAFFWVTPLVYFTGRLLDQREA